MARFTRSPISNWTYAFNNANRLTSRTVNGTTSAYTFDHNSNTLASVGRTMTWDSQNRLFSCVKAGVNGSANVTSSFVYNADGIRKQETTNAGGTSSTTDFLTDASLFVREVNHANGATLATYLVGLRGPEYKRDDVHGSVRWYVFDGLGSVVGEVDPNGNVSGSRKHDVYGLTRSVTGTITSKHGFVGSLGHASEDETGLIYMQARYCDPATGRFVSQDPKRNGNNWFIYCANNPINYIDSNGKVLSRFDTETAIVIGELLAAIGLAELLAINFGATALIATCFDAAAAFFFAASVALGVDALMTVVMFALGAAAVIAGVALIVGLAFCVAYITAAFVVSSWEGIDGSNTGNFDGPGWFGNNPNPKPED